MNIFIGMEASGALRRAFEACGHDVVSCDLRASYDGAANHIIGDVFETLALFADGWFDLAIFHPDCTFLTGSAEWAYGNGPYHQKVKHETLVGEARREARREAVKTASACLASRKARSRVIENPVGHLSSAIGKPFQIVQPYNFGDDASKKTCFWQAGKVVPHLVSTKFVAPRLVNGLPRWGNQTDSGQNKLSPSAERWSARSDFPAGLSSAIADQWGRWISAWYENE